MKKYFIITAVIGFLFAACNPNEELYENIEKNTPPYKVDFEITLTDDDYVTIKKLALPEAQTSADSAVAEAIDTYKSFGHNRPVSEYVGAFLDQEYIAPDSASSALVSYNYSLNEFDSLLTYKLTNDDYTAIGGAVADSLAFSYQKKPTNYLPDFLTDMDTVSNYVKYVTCKYIRPDFSRTDTSFAYTYGNGEWALVENAYILSADDYDSMGAPGQYNNFSSSENPDDYLPKFFSIKFPYASVGTSYTVFYQYYDGGAQTRFEAYELGAYGWSELEERTDQFVHNGIQWLFDPTVNYTMVKSDYQILVDYIADHATLSGYLDQQYLNTEYYYGASYYYDNFDMRVYKRRDNDPQGLYTDLSDDEVKAIIFERLKEGLDIFLELRFPDAEPVSNGVQVYYEVYFATYEPGDYFYKMRFKCTDTGTFEYESGPVSLQ